MLSFQPMSDYIFCCRLISLLVLSMAGISSAASQVAKSPADEAASFTLPDGFVVELVADESVMKKAVALNFDSAGRMWVTTADEYPFDGNEHPEKAAALYREGGRDGVLVFETPCAPGLQKPRLFAGKGLTDTQSVLMDMAMPMGVLPYKDGAIVHHGSELLFLRDTNGDGKADKREVLLNGFGVQDSHLMTHGFTRGPDDWIYFAQGAFNNSTVPTKEGPVVDAPHCKVFRMKPDGSQFEVVAWGHDNIWGFVIDPRGNMWLQEANDRGYPVAPFEPGMAYPGVGEQKPRPYAPFIPPLKQRNDCKMGGTGLSGLALSEDMTTWPPPWNDVFMIANPITNKLQAVKVHGYREGYQLEPGKTLPDGYREMEMEKLPDFLTSSDPQFRPVAIQFGPDGALYVVDWYNKIISHNEVDRFHPERDKTSTRIWRIRYKNAAIGTVPNLAKADNWSLLDHLKSSNQWQANHARFELIDRGANKTTETQQKLYEILAASLSDTKDANRLPKSEASLNHLLQALWTIEDGRDLTGEQHDVLAACNGQSPSINKALIAMNESTHDSMNEGFIGFSPNVDPSIGCSIAVHAARLPSSDAVSVMLRLCRDAAPVFTKPQYHYAFMRFLIRLGLEKHAAELKKQFEDTTKVASWDVETRALACLALDPPEAAARFVKVAPELKRTLLGDEIALLASQVNQPEVARMFADILTNPDNQQSALDALLKTVVPSSDETAKLITEAARALVKREPSPANSLLMVKLAKTYQVRELEPDVTAWLLDPIRTPNEQERGLQTLSELGSNNMSLFKTYSASADEGIKRDAVVAMASSDSPEAVPTLVVLWPQIQKGARMIALSRLAASKTQAPLLAEAVRDGMIPDLTPDAFTALSKVLGAEHPDVVALAKDMQATETLTPEQQKALDEKFVKFRALAEKPGDFEKGRNLVSGVCMGCHTINGKGGNLAPNLSGAGAMGTESLLRNILTPNAQLESGYYRYDAELNNGDLLSGFMVKQDDKSATIRQLGTEDRTLLRTEIKKLTVTKRSLMPEGLLDGLPPESISDIFTYLNTLK